MIPAVVIAGAASLAAAVVALYVHETKVRRRAHTQALIAAWTRP